MSQYTNPIDELLNRWREEARLNRRRGDERRAVSIDSMIEEVEEAIEMMLDQRVSIEAAAQISGHTAAHLRELLREGSLTRLKDRKGKLVVRVRELPFKRGAAPPAKIIAQLPNMTTPDIGVQRIRRVG